MRKVINIVVCLVLLWTAAACEDPVETIVDTDYNIKIELPFDLTDATLKEASIVLTNVRTTQTYTVKDIVQDGDGYSATVNVPSGVYNVKAKGTVRYLIKGKEALANVKAEARGQEVGPETDKRNMDLVFSTYAANAGLVIEEVFFSSNTYPGTQRPYTDDQYIKIHNNADTTIYLDRLALAESKFQTDMKWDVTPDYMREAISIAFIYLFPGSGHDFPLHPNKSILIAINGKNHLKINSNSFDLSRADFEIYDVSPNTEFVDEDNPGVRNMIKWYSDMWSYTVLHNKGSKSYAIVDVKCDSIEFLRDHFFHFTYPLIVAGDVYHGKDDAYWLPNSWVIDAEINSIKSDWLWQVFSPALDMGWTYCTETFKDKTRYGLAVIRKRGPDGKFIDTNNSTNDFLPRQQPSLRLTNNTYYPDNDFNDKRKYE